MRGVQAPRNEFSDQEAHEAWLASGGSISRASRILRVGDARLKKWLLANNYQIKTCNRKAVTSPPNIGPIPGWFLTKIQNDCRKRNRKLKRKNTDPLECHLTMQDIVDAYNRQNGLDPFDGIPLTFGRSRNEHDTFGIGNASPDRIDPSGHYTRDNLQLTTKMNNLMRGLLTCEEYKAQCIAVANHQARTNS